MGQGGEKAKGAAGMIVVIMAMAWGVGMAAACGECESRPKYPEKPPVVPTKPPSTGGGRYPSPSFPSPKYPSPSFPSPKYPSPSFPSPKYPSPSFPSPKTCPVSVAKLGVCTPLLGGVVGGVVGGVLGAPDSCCPLLGLLGLDVEVCLCLAIDANVLGLVTISVKKVDIVASILTSCGYKVPPNFACPS